LKQELIKIRLLSQSEKTVKPVVTHVKIENFWASIHINKLFEKIRNN